MASACVNNVAPPMPSPSSSSSSFGWFSSPVSFSRQDANYSKRTAPAFRMMSPVHEEEKTSSADPPEQESSAGGDFEFCLGHSGAMLPADELFFDGKLLPLHLSAAKSTTTTHKAVASTEEVSESPRKSDTSSAAGSSIDLHLSSPKAPRCSSRWKELLGFKKQNQNTNSRSSNTESTTTTAASVTSKSASSNSKSIRRHLLHRSSKSTGSSTDSFLSLPLLREDLDYYNGAAALIPSRLSLSSSSSSSSGSHDYDDLPRLSLDSDRPHSRSLHRNPTRMRQLNSRLENPRSAVAGRSQVVRRTPTEPAGGGITMDSPRMNSSGKVIFQSLERSSSSPGSFNGGPRSKHRSGCMERSYSAGVRVTPVLNVPVSSLLGSSSSSKPGGSAFGQLFSSSPQKRSESTANGTTSGRIHHQTRNRTDRRP